MKTIYIAVSIILMTTVSLAQSTSPVVSCHSSKQMSRLERITLSKKMKDWQARRASKKQQNDIYYIPLVFHVMSNAPSVTRIQQAVSEVNDAFANRDAYHTDQGADTRIQFCLAETAPDGGVTSGIVHVPSDYRQTDMDLDHEALIEHSIWNKNRYLNVWLVDRIDGEACAVYSGMDWWTRLGVGGYASADGIVVTSLSAELLTHELGHYFGLLHTWVGFNCKNDDCLIDGDMVCDTPPDKSIFGSCDDNSCHTDTLSNFSNGIFYTDVPDMGSNFMDYGNTDCALDFSAGQGERMRFFIEEYYTELASLNTESQLCEKPCEVNETVGFYSNLNYPTPGDTVTFTTFESTEEYFTGFEWSIAPYTGDWSELADSTFVISNERDLDLSFSSIGLYRITLRAWSVFDSTCFASFSRNLRVSCGVDARFYPDKRIIASKQPHPLFTDSVNFYNRSYNGISFEWEVRHQHFTDPAFNLPTVYSTEEHLTHYFREPGMYYITLTAINGDCENVSNTFPLPVQDPTIDGVPEIQEVQCFNADSIQVDFKLLNHGYDTINRGTPLSFYDNDPLSTSANLLATWELPNIAYGFDTTEFSAIIPGDIASLSELFIVFNDTGTLDLPISFPPPDLNVLSNLSQFPPSGYAELDYENNLDNILVEPTSALAIDTLLCSGDTLLLSYQDLFVNAFCTDSIWWESSQFGLLSTDEVMIYPVTSTDHVKVTIESVSGIKVTGSVNIQSSAPQVVIPDTVYRISYGESVVLQILDNGGNGYWWSPQSSLADPTVPSPLASPKTNTLYSVQVVNQDSCNSTHYVQVWVESSAHIPNLFTPNGDGKNDVLRAYGLRQVQSFSFRLVDRFGAPVFYTSDAVSFSNRGWRGELNSKPQPSGPYFWEVQGVYEDGRPVLLNGEKSGVVHLVR